MNYAELEHRIARWMAEKLVDRYGYSIVPLPTRPVGKHPALAAPYSPTGRIDREAPDDWLQARPIRKLKINSPKWPPLAFAERCTYPRCECAVSFPAGYKPSDATECPREG